MGKVLSLPARLYKSFKKSIWMMTIAYMLGIQEVYKEGEQKPEPIVIRFQNDDNAEDDDILDMSGYFTSIKQARAS